jgi:hypothetical protein
MRRGLLSAEHRSLLKLVGAEEREHAVDRLGALLRQFIAVAVVRRSRNSSVRLASFEMARRSSPGLHRYGPGGGVEAQRVDIREAPLPPRGLRGQRGEVAPVKPEFRRAGERMSRRFQAH